MKQRLFLQLRNFYKVMYGKTFYISKSLNTNATLCKRFKSTGEETFVLAIDKIS